MDIKELIEEIAAMDPCDDVPADKLALIIEGIVSTFNVTELSELTTMGSKLPKACTNFIYEGLPVNMRAVYRGSAYYIIFVTHNEEKYLLFKRNNDGDFAFYSSYTSATAVDWVKRAFNLSMATNSDNGLLSAVLYRYLDAAYDWCVSQGMSPIK